MTLAAWRWAVARLQVDVEPEVWAAELEDFAGFGDPTESAPDRQVEQLRRLFAGAQARSSWVEPPDS